MPPAHMTTHTHSSAASHALLPPSSFLYGIFFPASTHTPVGANWVQYSSVLEVYPIWQVPSPTYHSCKISWTVWQQQNIALDMTALDFVAYCHLSKVSKLEGANGRFLTGRQQSVAFHHLGHTGISTRRVPDLDTSLAINGLRKLAARYTGQDGRQSAHPAALSPPPVTYL